MSDCSLPHHHHGHNHQLFSHLPAEQDFQAIAELFRQLSDSSRLRLFWILCHTEECVINLAAIMEMSSPALSHHLRQLKECGLVVSRRAGKEVYYRASANAQAQLMHLMTEELSHLVCPDESEDEIAHSAPKPEQIEAIHRQLTENLSLRLTIDELARQHYLDRSTLKREFKKVYGLPIATYLKEFRIKKASELLKGTEMPIADIAAAVGYETSSKFTAAFKAMTHETPSEYRKNSRK